MDDSSDCRRHGYHRLTTAPKTPVDEPVDGLVVESEPDTITTGETITFTLRNLSDDLRNVGPASQYAFQGETPTEGETAWRDILYEEDYRPHSAILRKCGPGEVDTWTFRQTADAQLELDGRSLPGYLCPPLSAGRYRFVYLGLDGRYAELPAAEFAVR